MKVAFLSLAFLTAICAPFSNAQLASSANYQLLADGFGGGGGGACSVGFAAYYAPEPVSGDQVISANFRADMGFLAGNDPKPTNAPVVFGITPDCGPITGNVLVTITGFNFLKQGGGPTIQVTIGGAAVPALFVASDTQILALTPVGTVGQKNVVVTNLYGSGTLVNGYEYSAGLIPYGTGTPGCLGPQTLSAAQCPSINTPNFTLTCTNAPALALGLGIITDSPDFGGSLLFGLGILFHVDFAFATPTEIYSLDMTSDFTGFGTVVVPIPNNPGLIGKNYYAQAYWVETACVMGTVGNLSSSRGLHIIIEP